MKTNKAVAKLRKQRDRVIQIIRDDWRFPISGNLCQLVVTYLSEEASTREAKGFKRLPPPPPSCKSVGHCAMGALMFAAGVSNKYMEEHAGDECMNGTYLSALVKRRYGLDAVDASEIEGGNDRRGNAATPQERRQNVLKVVREIYRDKIRAAR